MEKPKSSRWFGLKIVLFVVLVPAIVSKMPEQLRWLAFLGLTIYIGILFYWIVWRPIREIDKIREKNEKK